MYKVSYSTDALPLPEASGRGLGGGVGATKNTKRRNGHPLLRHSLRRGHVYLPHPRPFPNALGKGDSLLKTVHFMRGFTTMCTKYRIRQMRSPSLEASGRGLGGGVGATKNTKRGTCHANPRHSWKGGVSAADIAFHISGKDLARASHRPAPSRSVCDALSARP